MAKRLTSAVACVLRPPVSRQEMTDRGVVVGHVTFTADDDDTASRYRQYECLETVWNYCSDSVTGQRLRTGRYRRQSSSNSSTTSSCSSTSLLSDVVFTGYCSGSDDLDLVERQDDGDCRTPNRIQPVADVRQTRQGNGLLAIVGVAVVKKRKHERALFIRDATPVKRRRCQPAATFILPVPGLPIGTTSSSECDTDRRSSRLVKGLRIQSSSSSGLENDVIDVDDDDMVDCYAGKNLNHDVSVCVNSSDQKWQKIQSSAVDRQKLVGCLPSVPHLAALALNPFSKRDGDCLNALVPVSARKYQRLNSDSLGFDGYESDTYLHRKSLEAKYHPIASLSNQPQMSPYHRAALVDWMTSLADGELLMHTETLFLAVNVLDRFLSTTPIATECFRLLGVTCLFIASKMEETFPPEVKQLLSFCVEPYTTKQLVHLEQLVLSRLRFSLMVPTAYFFLEYYCEEHYNRLNGIYSRQVFRRKRSIAAVILRSTLRDYGLCQYRPSLLALCVLNCVLRTTATDLARQLPAISNYAIAGQREVIDWSKINDDPTGYRSLLKFTTLTKAGTVSEDGVTLLSHERSSSAAAAIDRPSAADISEKLLSHVEFRAVQIEDCIAGIKWHLATL